MGTWNAEQIPHLLSVSWLALGLLLNHSRPLVCQISKAKVCVGTRPYVLSFLVATGISCVYLYIFSSMIFIKWEILLKSHSQKPQLLEYENSS